MDLEPERRFGSEYHEHLIFEQLLLYSKFYDSLSFSIMNLPTEGISGLLNLDIYVFSSMKGTIDSISDTLRKGRINDSYTLLRKYYDLTIINVYTNLYLLDNINSGSFIVTKIENWKNGTEKLPEYRVMSKYIKESSQLERINDLLKRDERYKQIRNRCNDHTHYNFYRHLLLNDNEIYNPNRLKYLNGFSQDIQAIFIQHFAYIFSLKDYYMMSSDYIDSLEMGLKPEEDSQYWVANFVQEVFDKVVKCKRYDIAKELKENTYMQLEL